MTIPLTGTNGLFTRLGVIEGALEGLDNFLGRNTPPPAVLTATTGTGTLTAGTYYVRNTYTSIAGETLASFETSVVLSATGEIIVTSPPPYQGATGWNTYISSASGTETKQNASPTAIGTNYTQSAPLSAGSALPTSNTFYDGLKAIGPVADAIAAQFSTQDQNIVNLLYQNRDQYRTVHTAWQNYLVNLAQACLVQMVNNDTPLAVKDVQHALQVLISQMKANAQSVQKPTVTTVNSMLPVTAGSSNTGQGVLLASPIGPNGLQLDYMFNETINAICSVDGQSNSGTAGQETFSFYSPVAELNEAQWDWPLGSGLNGYSLNAVDATVNGVAGQLLQNGAFGKWTNASIGPDNWLIQTGTVGTQIVQATGSGVYKGTSGLSFVGDGSTGATLTSIAQQFNTTPNTNGNSGGTSLVLYPLTVYALNLALKVSSVPAAGVLQIAITDGSNNVVTNFQGVQQLLSIPLTGATTSFVLHNIFFQTPAQNPSTGYRLQIKLTTALSTGSTAYIGHVALTPAVQPYKGGPYVALFSGTPNFILQDTFSVNVANQYNSRWQLALERLFGVRSLTLQQPYNQIPSAATPTIADSLIG